MQRAAWFSRTAGEEQVAVTWESSLALSTKVKHVQTPCPAIPLLGTYPRGNFAHVNQERSTRRFIAAKIWK